jgi:hypothetical protein
MYIQGMSRKFGIGVAMEHGQSGRKSRRIHDAAVQGTAAAGTVNRCRKRILLVIQNIFAQLYP